MEKEIDEFLQKNDAPPILTVIQIAGWEEVSILCSLHDYRI